jgi:hypothetical protein
MVAGGALAVGEGLTRGVADGLGLSVIGGLAEGTVIGTEGARNGTVVMALGECFGKTKITLIASTRNVAPAPIAVYHGCSVATSSHLRWAGFSRSRSWAGSSSSLSGAGSPSHHARAPSASHQCRRSAPNGGRRIGSPGRRLRRPGLRRPALPIA